MGSTETRADQAERLLAAAQEITHIGSWQWELATNAVTWSDELYRIYGLAPRTKEITLDVFASMLHPDDRDRILGEVRGALERGGRFTYLERIVRADGQVRELDTVGDVLRNDEGRVIGLIGTCRDVTEDRRRDQTIRRYAEIVENVQIALSVWEVEGDPRTARLVSFNPAAERAFGSVAGRTIADVFAAPFEAPLVEAIDRAMRDGATSELSLVVLAAQPRRTFSVKAFPLLDRNVGLALEDVTTTVRAQRLQDAEQRALEAIAAGAPLDEVLASLVLAIEALAPPTLGSILLVDETGSRIKHGAAPSLPVEYSRAIDGAPVGPKGGSCGTAVYERRPVLVDDIDTDPLWADYREIAKSAGLRACWSYPIFASDARVVGTFALYYREPRKPSPDELDMVARAAHVAAIAIQRKTLDEQLRALSAHVEGAREEERTAAAREIHDELGQALTALKMDLAWVARRSGDNVKDKLEAMSRMTDDIIDSVRRISAGLRPGVLDDLGLIAAIEWQAQEFEARTGTTCVVRTSAGDASFDRDLSTAVFRVFQEALTNVARHAEASHVEVSLECADGRLRLTVRDDGKGIAERAMSGPGSLGLLGARERVRRLGGDLTLASGKGTTFCVEVPLTRRSAA
jgi:PAS domain S-box-containing protein